MTRTQRTFHEASQNQKSTRHHGKIFIAKELWISGTNCHNQHIDAPTRPQLLNKNWQIWVFKWAPRDPPKPCQYQTIYMYFQHDSDGVGKWHLQGITYVVVNSESFALRMNSYTCTAILTQYSNLYISLSNHLETHWKVNVHLGSPENKSPPAENGLTQNSREYTHAVTL